MKRQDVRRARDDLGTFAALVDRPLTSWQLEALRLATWLSVIVAPRQSGKSRALSVLACHHAYRHPRSLVLIVSAGEVAARRLLAEVRSLAAHPLLRGSVVDESTYSVTLSNGATIRCTPSSERQIRGWAVDLLLVDEAAVISDELLAAALPTTAARPDARVVMASSPWADEGPFYAAAVRGFAGDEQTTRAFRWKLTDCAWISPATVEAARATLSPLRFAAEYEGEFVGSSDAYFAREDLLACTADYPLRRAGDGTEPVSVGLDWGRARDAHAIVLAGVAHDYGVNGRPVVVLPWVETSRRPYGQQVAEVAALAGAWRLVAVHSETNGVGAFPTEELTRLLRRRAAVTPVASSQASKENGYGRLATMLSRREIVLPAHEELIRQLGGVTATPTPSGGLRIAAVTEAVHDDLPDATVLALSGLPSPLLQVAATDPPAGIRWVETPEGVRVPVPVRTRRAHVSATIAIPQGRALPGMTPREGVAGQIERMAWGTPEQPQRTWPGW